MSNFQLDAGCALIVVDLQNAIAEAPLIHPLVEVVAQTKTLLYAFRSAGKPVILVNADGLAPGRTDFGTPSLNFPEGWADLLPELRAEASDIQVTKRTWSAFVRTGLAERLETLRVTQVVIVGVSTSMGVESTARDAYALGFNVALATDAVSDVDADMHHNSMTRIFPRLGQSAAAATIADAVAAA